MATNDGKPPIHCELPAMAAARTMCGEPRQPPTYPIQEFVRLCTLPAHEEFGQLCFDCISKLGDITDLAMEQKLSTGRFHKG